MVVNDKVISSNRPRLQLFLAIDAASIHFGAPLLTNIVDCSSIFLQLSSIIRVHKHWMAADEIEVVLSH